MNGNFNFPQLNVNQFLDTPAFQDIRSHKLQGSIRLSSGTYQIAWNPQDQAQVSRTDKNCCSWFTDLFSRGCAPTRARQLQTEFNIQPAQEDIPLLDLKFSDHSRLLTPIASPDSSPRVGRLRENAVDYKNLSDDNLNAPVTQIRLRGLWTDGHHQELMITLQDNTLVRVSRNNHADTFQVGAREDGNYEMSDLAISSPGNITLQDILNAFDAEHRLHPSYEQANCQTFAQNVLRAVDPDNKNLLREDDFM